MNVASAASLARRSGTMLLSVATFVARVLALASREITAPFVAQDGGDDVEGREDGSVASAGQVVMLLCVSDRRYVESHEAADGETMVFALDASGTDGGAGRAGRVTVEARAGKDPYAEGRGKVGVGALVARVAKEGGQSVEVNRFDSLDEAVEKERRRAA